MEKVQVPKFYFKQEVQNQYNNVSLAIVRELIQNSRDAGARNIWFEFEDGRYSCRDDGHGMNETDFRQYYLNLGGTLKHTDSIGGFGAAKKLTFAADSWTAIGNGFICHGEGSEFNIEKFIPQQGFVIVGNDPTYEKSRFRQSLKTICHGSQLPLTIWLDGEIQSQGRKLHPKQLLWDFGFARLYAPRMWEWSDYHENTGYKYIRTKGLLTRTEWTGGDFIYYLEIDDPLRILTENRESIREEYSKKISEEIQAIIKKGIERKTEYKQITLYGIPKQRYYKPSNGTVHYETPRAIVLNQNGEYVKDLQMIDYQSEVGQWPIEKPFDQAQDEPNNGFVTSIDTEAIAELSEIHTEMGILKFAHKALDYWDYPFAIIEDGKKQVQMFTKQNELTAKAKKSLTITLTIGKMLADDLEIPCPIPGVLFSDSDNGLCSKTGPYEIISLSPDLVLEDTPFGVLELIIHEFAHHWQSGHSQQYENERMRIARKIGGKAEIYLSIIKGLQNV